MTPFDYLILFLMSLGSALAATYMKYYHAPQALELPPEPLNPITPTPMTTAPQRVYKEALSLIGTHIALAANVPEENGCVTAVAYILDKCGYAIPSHIVGVNDLNDWMVAHDFKETKRPLRGCIVTTHRADRLDPQWAHCGIWGNDWVMSNTSYDDPGLGLVKGDFQANMRTSIWVPFYEAKKCVTRYFIPN